MATMRSSPVKPFRLGYGRLDGAATQRREPPSGREWEAAMVVKLCSRILAAALAVGFVFCTSTQSESNCSVPPEIDFDEPVSYPTCPLPRSITTGDFNGDGALDFAVACGANVVTAYRNLGRGSFAE